MSRAETIYGLEMISNSFNILFRLLLLLLFIVLAYPETMSACNNGLNKKFYIDDYGAVGDGSVNDIAAFQALAKDVNANGGGIVVFPLRKEFRIDIENDYSCGHKATPDDGAMAFNFEHCERIVVDMNGSTIFLSPNHSTKYSFFLFFDCSSFSLSNGILVGDVVGHDYSPVMYKGKEEKTSHQWGYGIQVRGSKGEIKNMNITRMTGDGIYFGSVRLSDGVYHAKVQISDCEISYCRRNGISCASSLGFDLIDTKIHHIGDWEKTDEMPVSIAGCKPKAGIDFEYEGKAWDVGDIRIYGCSISNCTEKCIVTSNTSRPVVSSFEVSDCVFSGSVVHTNNLSSRGRKEIRDCRFFDASAFLGDAKVYQCIFEMGVVMNYVSRTSFYDCEFNGHLEQLGPKHGCFMAGTNMEQTLFQRCKFKNIKGYNDSTPAFQGFSGYVHPVNIHFVSCDFENCSFVVSQKNYDSHLTFDKCSLKNGCLIHNMGKEAIVFNDSELYDVQSYVTQNGVFFLNNCKIIQEDKTLACPLLSFGTHTMNKCSVVDKVGITPFSMRQYGVRGYRIVAKSSDFKLENDNPTTEGLSLTGGSLAGVKKESFKGTQEKTRFR